MLSQRSSTVLLSTVAILLIPSAGSQAQVRREAIAPEHGWRETLAERTPVGRTTVPGILARAGEERVEPRSFFVHLPARAAAFICVSILSQDGRYSAELAYRSPARGGATELQLPTEYAKTLASYAERQLAIRAQLRENCGNDGGPAVLASWNSAGLQDTFTVLLNSDFASWIIATDAGDVVEQVACDPLEGAGISFNRGCRVPLRWIGAHDLMIRARQRSGPRFFFQDEPLHLAFFETNR